MAYTDTCFSIDEIKDVVWRCGGDKAPSLGNFTFKFFKNMWDVMKYDVFHFMKHFEEFECIVCGCNSSFINLIPKCKDTLLLGYYRQISKI